ncbi:transporter substrate-binding domain-containing protein [Pelagibacterium sp. H642]|uniref:substrate-binding periplasmic protein n=1 Tax=Pelagibacterium sp. H642 TaxID=1881069 RepID=UPI0028149DB7|nr:transporter substrate-binding domain-containing protein [Pelagibacterium sp. H642]WMT89031.1 transporter substrate-binding domain-containing protein [Pelagibacterium sp. H642]
MAATTPPRDRPQRRSGFYDLLPLVAVFALLFAVSFLPPDTSRAEVDRLGRLSVCMPTLYPPLVTGNADAPGFEVELMQQVADRLGWRLNIVSNAAMGRDFNPRNWRINRAQCQVLAGGIALNTTTQSFLDTSAPHMVTGWALVAPPGETIETVESPVGFLAGLTGLNRIELGQYLRHQEISASIVNDARALRSGLESGEFSAAITEALLAQQTFGDTDYEITVLGEPLERFSLGIGFWKGDMTLKRAVEGVLADLWDDGTMAEIAGTYGLDADILCPPNATGCA